MWKPLDESSLELLDFKAYLAQLTLFDREKGHTESIKDLLGFQDTLD